MGKKAIVLRMKPEGIDIVSRAVEKSELVIGWGNHCRLFDSNLSRDEVRESIRKEYCPEDSDGRRAGSAAGHVWRFIRELEIGDYVVIPHNSEFYVAKVTSEARLGEYSGLSSKVFIRSRCAIFKPWISNVSTFCSCGIIVTNEDSRNNRESK